MPIFARNCKMDLKRFNWKNAGRTNPRSTGTSSPLTLMTTVIDARESIRTRNTECPPPKSWTCVCRNEGKMEYAFLRTEFSDNEVAGIFDSEIREDDAATITGREVRDAPMILAEIASSVSNKESRSFSGKFPLTTDFDFESERSASV